MSKIWRLLQVHRLFYTLCYVVLCLVSIVSVSHPAYTLGDQTIAVLTNVERANNGLASLSWNTSLSQAAWLKVNDMCTQGYWAHTAPNGATAWTFMNQAGYRYTTAGENLARDYGGDAETIAAWMASPGHRANILKPAFADIGIASKVCTLDGSPATLVVALYGTTGAKPNVPAAPSPKPVPVAQPAVTAKSETPAAQPVPVAVSVVQPTPVKKPELSMGMKLWQLLLNSQNVPLFEQLVVIPFSEPRVVAYQDQ